MFVADLLFVATTVAPTEHVCALVCANAVVRATDLAVAPYTPPTSHEHPASRAAAHGRLSST